MKFEALIDFSDGMTVQVHHDRRCLARPGKVLDTDDIKCGEYTPRPILRIHVFVMAGGFDQRYGEELSRLAVEGSRSAFREVTAIVGNLRAVVDCQFLARNGSAAPRWTTVSTTMAPGNAGKRSRWRFLYFCLLGDPEDVIEPDAEIRFRPTHKVVKSMLRLPLAERYGNISELQAFGS